MADLFWPGGVPDDPLLEGLNWRILGTGQSFATESGDLMTGPGGLGTIVTMTPTYPMSNHQFNGLFLPWWLAPRKQGGCDNGMHAFWLRDPMDRKPWQWIRQPDADMRPERDGLGWLVMLPLRSLPR